jgi:hypothetical protein
MADCCLCVSSRGWPMCIRGWPMCIRGWRTDCCLCVSSRGWPMCIRGWPMCIRAGVPVAAYVHQRHACAVCCAPCAAHLVGPMPRLYGVSAWSRGHGSVSSRTCVPPAPASPAAGLGQMLHGQMQPSYEGAHRARARCSRRAFLAAASKSSEPAQASAASASAAASVPRPSLRAACRRRHRSES